MSIFFTFVRQIIISIPPGVFLCFAAPECRARKMAGIFRCPDNASALFDLSSFSRRMWKSLPPVAVVAWSTQWNILFFSVTTMVGVMVQSKERQKNTHTLEASMFFGGPGLLSSM